MLFIYMLLYVRCYSNCLLKVLSWFFTYKSSCTQQHE